MDEGKHSGPDFPLTTKKGTTQRLPCVPRLWRGMRLACAVVTVGLTRWQLQEQRGRSVLQVSWPNTRHVEHFRQEPERYTEAVDAFFRSLPPP